MAFLTIKIPPGVRRTGPEHESAGAYYDCQLARWRDGVLRPINGWEARANGPSSPSVVAGAARAMFAWRDNQGGRWLAIGTHAGLHVCAADGSREAITPSGLTAGRPEATRNQGFGGGFFGRGSFGTPRPGTVSYLPATVWSLDNFGQDLLALNADDGRLFRWERDPTIPAAVVPGAPTGGTAQFVAEEGFVVVLGASGVRRRVKWADQRSLDFTISALSQAGEFDLQTRGELMCGRALQGQGLLFTDVDVWTMRYLGYPLVYGFKRLEQGCGAISQGCVAVMDRQAAWMSKDRFWLFDGAAVQPLPCEVEHYVFSDLNRIQASKVTAWHNSVAAEIWWHYPSASSDENDRYVAWCYGESVKAGRPVWIIGKLARTAGADKGVFPYPVLMGADGLAYDHELGFAYTGATPPAPFVETGPMEMGEGDRWAEIQAVIPDEKTSGDCAVSFFGRPYPNGPEAVFGPYGLRAKTDVLVSARQLRMRITGATASDWCFGAPRLDVVLGEGL